MASWILLTTVGLMGLIVLSLSVMRNAPFFGQCQTTTPTPAGWPFRLSTSNCSNYPSNLNDSLVDGGDFASHVSSALRLRCLMQTRRSTESSASCEVQASKQAPTQSLMIQTGRAGWLLLLLQRVSPLGPAWALAPVAAGARRHKPTI